MHAIFWCFARAAPLFESLNGVRGNDIHFAHPCLNRMQGMIRTLCAAVKKHGMPTALRTPDVQSHAVSVALKARLGAARVTYKLSICAPQRLIPLALLPHPSTSHSPLTQPREPPSQRPCKTCCPRASPSTPRPARIQSLTPLSSSL